LADIYHETIVSRSPEIFSVEVDVPRNAWLDLNLGTVSEGAVTFHVAVGEGDAQETLLTQTLTRPHRWQPAPVDLASHAGRQKLIFSLDVDEQRVVGFWGSPTIRTHNTMPATTRTAGEALGGITPPQGVILILDDTLRKDHLSAYGYERRTSPNIDSLAGQGTLFLDNVSQATWTKVSTPAIMTSLYPTSHRVAEVFDRLSSQANTLAESYRAAGFATVAYSSVMFTGRYTNMHQGFEELYEASSVEDPAHVAKTAQEYVDRASDWIDRHQDAPFFMFLHVFDLHDPFEPRSPYDAVWADPFSEDTMHAGEPFIVVSESGGGRPSISDDGVLVYSTTAPGMQQLAWFNRQGEFIENISQPQDQITQPRLSPSGDRVAAVGVLAGIQSIRIHDLERDVATRLTKESGGGSTTSLVRRWTYGLLCRAQQRAVRHFSDQHGRQRPSGSGDRGYAQRILFRLDARRGTPDLRHLRGGRQHLAPATQQGGGRLRYPAVPGVRVRRGRPAPLA
jgi:hypothetical protein